MSKITLPTVTGSQNISTINDNFAKVADALNNKALYRDNPVGEPNQMNNDLDMNGKRVYNLPAPIADNEPVRKKDIEDLYGPIGSKKTLRVSDVDISELPSASQRRNKLVSFDNEGNPSVQYPSDESALALRIAIQTPTGDDPVGGFLEYDQLRDYTGDATLIPIIDPIKFGYFKKDTLDLSSLDNDGTVIVDNLNRRWKRIYEGPVNVLWFGAVGDGVSDDTAAIQAAIDYAKAVGGSYTLIVPAGVYRLGSVLTVDSPLRIVGEGCAPYVGALGTTGEGSWLYFDHSDKGINIDGPAIMSGVVLEKFGTRRNQPVPSSGWTPNAHDYDIYIDNADVLIDELLLLNPTKGVFLGNGNAGRLEIGTLRGQAFQTMLRVDTSYDVVKINNLHQWPFWQDDPRVHAYTLQNLDVLYFERTDNPMLMNIFTIFARSGIRFGQNANGKTSKIHLVNADFDRGKFGVWVDNTVTTGVTGQFANVTYQWETSLSGAKGIFVEGNFSELDFVNTRSDGSADSAIHIAGSGNKINLSGRTTAKFYDGSATNVAAIYAGSGNIIDIDGYPIIESGGGAGGRYGGNGEIRVDEWRAYSLTVTSTGGLITALGAVSGLFKRYGNTVDIQIDITITTNGTGSGALRATIPTQSAAQAVGIGRDVNVGGAALTGTISFGTTYVDIRKYDNSYPASNGSRLVVNASYRVA